MAFQFVNCTLSRAELQAAIAVACHKRSATKPLLLTRAAIDRLAYLSAVTWSYQIDTE